MMNFEELTQYFVLAVMVACLVIGYLLKHSLDFVPNKLIPLILAIVGLVLNLAISGFTLENAIYGALMGLASTGLHQAFTRFIEGTKEE